MTLEQHKQLHQTKRIKMTSQMVTILESLTMLTHGPTCERLLKSSFLHEWQLQILIFCWQLKTSKPEEHNALQQGAILLLQIVFLNLPSDLRRNSRSWRSGRFQLRIS